MKTLLFSILYLFITISLLGQHRGATIEKRELYLLAHPEYAQKMKEMDDDVNAFMQQRARLKTNLSEPIMTIPVVIHLLYNTEAENLTDEQLVSQIEVLNEDFRKQNADTVHTPDEFKAVAADMQIEFCLAIRGPDGEVTTGIERKKTDVTRFNYIIDNVKSESSGGLDAWDSKTYLNIWVCNLGDDVLGYAQFPGMNPATDGVVIHYEYFGRGSRAKEPFHLGRTCTHEVGHWLGLEHPWGGGGCDIDDDIADTPLCSNDFEARENDECQGPGDQCGEGHRMIENYMDYSQDACFSLFTQGQANRVLGIINTQRVSLKSSGGCRLYEDVPLVNFDVNKTTVYQGGEVQFESFVEDEDSLYWLFEGADTSTSSLDDPTISYLEVGEHPVTLIAKNTLGDSALTKDRFIKVLETKETTTYTSFYLGGENILERSTVGYITGHNNFNDLAKANYYESPKPYVAIEGIKYVFGHVQFDDPDATIDATLWSVGPDGKPLQELYSQAIKISELIVDDTLTIMLEEPIEMLDPFFAGIQLNYQIGQIEENSVALYMTKEGEVAPGMAWELLSNREWLPFTEPDFSWGKNVALSIYPMLKMLPPEIDFIADETNFFVDEQVVVRNFTRYAYDFSWNSNGGIIVDYEEGFSPVVKYEVANVYDLGVIASNFLYEREEVKNDYLTVKDWPLSVQDGVKLSISVYPNPFRDKVNITSEGQIISVKGYDLMGRELFFEEIGAKNHVLDLNNVQNGVFLLEVLGIKGKNSILMYKH